MLRILLVFCILIYSLINSGLDINHEKTLSCSNPSIVFFENFEGPDPLNKAHNLEIGTDHGLSIVKNPLQNNNQVARIELRDSDPLVKRGTRAEITIVKGVLGKISQDTWYAFDAYFPKAEYLDEEDTDLISQWHQSGTPSASIRIKNGRFQLKVGDMVENRKTIDIGEVTKDQWHKFTIHFIHSNDKDGLVELWHNGNKIIEKRGGNMYAGMLPKWKIGLYKSTWNDEKTTTSRRVYYLDNIKVGNDKASYEALYQCK